MRFLCIIAIASFHPLGHEADVVRHAAVRKGVRLHQILVRAFHAPDSHGCIVSIDDFELAVARAAAPVMKFDQHVLLLKKCDGYHGAAIRARRQNSCVSSQLSCRQKYASPVCQKTRSDSAPSAKAKRLPRWNFGGRTSKKYQYVSSSISAINAGV